MKIRRFYMGELTWPDVKEFLSDHDVVVVPVGSCEQHGPHPDGSITMALLYTRGLAYINTANISDNHNL